MKGTGGGGHPSPSWGAPEEGNAKRKAQQKAEAARQKAEAVRIKVAKAAGKAAGKASGKGGKSGKGAGKKGKPTLPEGITLRSKSNGKPICFKYNDKHCNKKNCSMVHVCQICEGDHPWPKCESVQ